MHTIHERNTELYMNTEDYQEHQGEQQEKKGTSFFLPLANAVRSCFDWCREHKQPFLLLVAAFLSLLVLCVYGIEKSRKRSLYNLVKADSMVQELRHPSARVGEEEKKPPSYEEIESTLTASKEIQKRFQGVLSEESIIAQKECPKALLKDLPYPLQEGTWVEFATLAGQLERKDFTSALSSLHALLEGIAQKEKETLYPELVGYLRRMEMECLKALHRPIGDSAVEFGKWKTAHPDIAQQMSSLVPEDDKLL